MNRITVSAVMFTLLSIGMLTLAFNSHLIKADGPAGIHTVQGPITETNSGDLTGDYMGTCSERINTPTVNGSPSLGNWESFASAYDNSTTISEPNNAFDRKDYYPLYDIWNYTYAEFEIKDDRWFEVSGWDYSGGTIDHVNFTAVWEVVGISDDDYRFLYFVDPSATEGILLNWATGNQPKHLTTWKQPTDPDGGSWTETKINNIRFRVDTRHDGAHDAARIKIWELYLTVGYTPPTVSIKPASTVDSTIAPKNPEVLRPDGAGFQALWDGDYTDWDEATQNGDTDYVNTTTHGRVEASTFGDCSEAWDIAGVRVVIWARLTATDSDPEEVIPFIRVGTTLKWGPNIPLTTTYTEYKTEWAVNPVTGNNWTQTEINALQAGVRSYAKGSWTGEMRVTQIYLEVVGMRHQVRVHVQNAVNIWGWQFNLSYDPTVLHGVNWEGDDPVYIDPFLSSGGATVLSAPGPGFDNTQGELALTSAFQTTTDPAKLVDGSGNLAAVAFTVTGVGSTNITLGPPCIHSEAVHDYDLVLEGLRGEYIKVHKADGFFRNIEMDAHDIATTNVTLSKNIVGQGCNLSLNVTLSNEGAFTETFNVTAYYNETAITLPDGKNYTTITLTSANSTTITLIWNTIGVVKGDYAVSAYAWPVPGEMDTADNKYVNGWVVVTIPGDIDGDYDVDFDDIVTIAMAYGSRPGDSNWNPNADIDGDGDVDFDDVVTAAMNYGKSDC